MCLSPATVVPPGFGKGDIDVALLDGNAWPFPGNFERAPSRWIFTRH